MSQQDPAPADLAVADLPSLFDAAADAGTWDEAWPWIVELTRRPAADVVAEARGRLHDDRPDQRAVAADVLGRVGGLDGQDAQVRDDALAALTALLPDETDADVLTGIANGLGFLRDPRGLGPLLSLRRHEDADVRGVVAAHLPDLTDPGHPDPEVVAALAELSRDADTDVRDWATFALGTQLDVDTPEVRSALAGRLDDADEDTRWEAVVGLAKRGDDRARPPVEAALRRAGREAPGKLAVDAAAELADPDLHPLLVALRGSGDVDQEALEVALARTDPAGRTA